MSTLIGLVLAMPGFAFGFGFGPQGPKSTTQGTYTPPVSGNPTYYIYGF